MSVRKISFALMFFMCLSLIGQATAVEDDCSITLTFSYRGRAVNGGSITLCCVTALTEDTGVETAQALAAQISDLAGETKAIEQGKVLFDSLPPGIYLVAQQTGIPGFLPISPFLVRLPMEQNGTLLHAVTAAPKLAPYPASPETGDQRWPFLLFGLSSAALILAFVSKKFRLRL